MGKIIINNTSSVCDLDAVELVKKVIASGRVSGGGKQYCYLTTFNDAKNKKKYVVTSDLNKKSDKFTVYNDAY